MEVILTDDNERRERMLRAQKKRMQEPPLLTRRKYLLLKTLMESGTNIFQAREAVATTALAHPEWDMNEERTWVEWEGINR